MKWILRRLVEGADAGISTSEVGRWVRLMESILLKDFLFGSSGVRHRGGDTKLITY